MREEPSLADAGNLSDHDALSAVFDSASEASADPKALVSGQRLTVGLAGRGIQQSRSPRLHEIEGARHGLDYRYVLLDFDRLGLDDAQLGDVLKRARAAGFAGVNVTHPFKEQVIGLIDSLSPDARTIGSVNTVVFGKDGDIGHNTDCWGFERSFRLGLPGRQGDRVLLLGAGGAGRAVGRALLNLGLQRILIYDANQERAERLAGVLNRGQTAGRTEWVRDVQAAMGEVDGIVNATPVGMEKYHGVPLPRSALTPRHWVADIVYFPERTELVALAEGIGCPTLRGSGMAVFQAAKAFELFSNMRPDCDRMLQSYQFTAPLAV
jgi:shikimate dehydrogenase